MANRRSRSATPAEPPLPLLSAAAMAEGIRRGDPAAFDAFHAAYFDRVYRYLLVVAAGDDEHAREAVQETMLRVLRYVKPLPDHDALWRWLTTVARTAWIDLVRRRHRVPEPRAELAPVADPLDADDVLLDALERAMHGLPEADRRLLEAHYLGGTPQAELASDRATTRKAIESRLARIRKRLKAILLREVGRD